ncbi:13236_t:CDS:2 [Dentiscutata erythropus]|uniref:13236_t:CDS:1 n=1 Tax=Dentiscutata erythropus TaxID=1348616 RepID=A0A9N9FAB6_9GLOM|nr:13236_t:CDS:2 [Dentiscutata erythropus]
MDSQNLSDDFGLPYSTNLATESYNTASLRTARRHVIAHTDNFSFPGTITNHEINPLSSVLSHYTTNERVYNMTRKTSNSSIASTFTNEVSTLNSDTPLIDSSNSNPDNKNAVHDNSPLLSPSRSTRQFTHIHKKRLSRTMQHISSFIRITVNISPTISFPVTIEKSYTIERLARQIEAEYAFKYGDIEGCLHEPLEVGLLYDVSMVALRFRDLVGDVLEHGDVVNENRSFSLPITNDDISQINDNNPIPLNQTIHPSISPVSDPYLSLNLVPSTSQSSQSNFSSILTNILALNYFQKFTIREFSVENLLFWLDIELFAAGTCDIEDNYFEDQQTAIIHARYIYLTYISSNSPLQVNLSDEIRKDITWPLDDDCIIERNMFDEAQEAVYQLMKGHSFTRFETSPEWEECEKIKADNPKEYEDREMIEPLDRYFRPNMSLMLAITMGLDDNCNPAPTSHHYKEQTLHSILSQYFPETILLDNNGKRKQDNIVNVRSNEGVSLNGYFNNENRMTNAQKMRKIKKERKLRWVFGEKIGRIKDQPVNLPGGFRYESKKLAKDIWNKKKKKDKLESIFGRGLKDRNSFKDSLPRSPDNTSTPKNNARDNIHSFTLNVLSPNDRRRMIKSNKKLQVMLGEALDENMIRQNITIPAAQLPCLSYNKSKFNNEIGVSNKTHHVRRASDSMIISPLPSPNSIITPPATPPTLSDENDEKNSLKHQSMNSATAFTNTRHSLTFANRDTKEYRRKKLQKLNNFLGECVPIDIVLGESDSYRTSLPEPLPNPPKRKSRGRPNSLSFSSKKNTSTNSNDNTDAQTSSNIPRLSAIDRRRHLHRAIKLEKMFGEAPPQDLIVQKLRSRNLTDSVSSIDIHRRSIMSLEYLMENDREAMYDLIDYIADSDGENVNDDEYEEQFAVPLSAPATPHPGNSLKFDLPPADQKQQKLKGIRKLSHFFGATYGQMFPDQVLGELLGDLEREIREEARQNEVDKAVVAGLMGQLEELRAKNNETDEIRKRLELNRKKRDLKPESVI